MNKLVVVLSVSTLACAGSAVYLNREMSAAHAVLRVAPPAIPLVEPIRATLAESAQSTSSPHLATAHPAPTAPSDDMKTKARAWSVSQIPIWRKILQDPAQRADTIREFRASLRRGYPQLAADLDLTEDEYARLVDLQTDQQMRSIEARYECAITPNCDDLQNARDLEAIFAREATDLLGVERKQRFDDYLDNGGERNSVTYLRGVMPDSYRLSDAQAVRLTEALGAVRRRIVAEYAQRGAQPMASYSLQGVTMHSNMAQGNEQRLAEISEFQRRQRERAAEVLTAEQLKVFERTQGDVLEGSRQGFEFEAQRARKP